jgi:hypothetical protein
MHVNTGFTKFVNRDSSVKNFFLLVVSFILIAGVKIYIRLAFLPALALWILLTFSHRIHRSSMRFIGG